MIYSPKKKINWKIFSIKLNANNNQINNQINNNNKY
jgi:hypothetical protein